MITAFAIQKMSMYKFVKGSRLFVQGKREAADFDDVHDVFANGRGSGGGSGRLASRDSGGVGGSRDEDEIRAVHTLRTMHVDGSREWERSGRTTRSGGVRTRSTRTVRKVTTVTRGEQSVTSESVLSYHSGDAPRRVVDDSKRSLKFRVLDKEVQRG